MTSYIIGRLAAAVPVVFVIALTVFVLSHMLPGDPILFIAGASESQMPPAQLAAIRAEYGLDKPVWNLARQGAQRRFRAIVSKSTAGRGHHRPAHVADRTDRARDMAAGHIDRAYRRHPV